MTRVFPNPAAPFDVSVNTISNPGANQNITYTLPSSVCTRFYRVTCLIFTFSAGATAGNRFVTIRYKKSGDSNHFLVVPVDTVAAGASIAFTCAVGAKTDTSSTGGNRSVPIPDVLLEPGDQVVVMSNWVDASDNFNTIRIQLEQYL